ALELLPPHMHAFMHVGHEFMEMRTALAGDRTRLKEQVHQHGLAAAYLAVEIKSLDRLLRLLPSEQPAERRRFARQTMCREPRLELRHGRQHGLLRGIA